MNIKNKSDNVNIKVITFENYFSNELKEKLFKQIENKDLDDDQSFYNDLDKDSSDYTDDEGEKRYMNYAKNFKTINGDKTRNIEAKIKTSKTNSFNKYFDDCKYDDESCNKNGDKVKRKTENKNDNINLNDNQINLFSENLWQSIRLNLQNQFGNSLSNEYLKQIKEQFLNYNSFYENNSSNKKLNLNDIDQFKLNPLVNLNSPINSLSKSLHSEYTNEFNKFIVKDIPNQVDFSKCDRKNFKKEYLVPKKSNSQNYTKDKKDFSKSLIKSQETNDFFRKNQISQTPPTFDYKKLMYSSNEKQILKNYLENNDKYKRPYLINNDTNNVKSNFTKSYSNDSFESLDLSNENLNNRNDKNHFLKSLNLIQKCEKPNENLRRSKRNRIKVEDYIINLKNPTVESLKIRAEFSEKFDKEFVDINDLIQFQNSYNYKNDISNNDSYSEKSNDKQSSRDSEISMEDQLEIDTNPDDIDYDDVIDASVASLCTTQHEIEDQEKLIVEPEIDQKSNGIKIKNINELIDNSNENKNELSPEGPLNLITKSYTTPSGLTIRPVSKINEDFGTKPNIDWSIFKNLDPNLFIQKITDIEYFECPNCYKKFRYKSDMKKHFRIHTGERPYMCNICIKSFRRRSHLTAHLRTHSSERHFNCHLCDKKFKDNESLMRHIMKFHRIEKPLYNCVECTEVFKRQTELKAHVRAIHSNYMLPSADKVIENVISTEPQVEPIFKCNVCEKIYTFEANYLSHKCFMQNSIEDFKSNPVLNSMFKTQLKCEFCPKTFFSEGDLKKHTRSHNAERTYQCDLCPKAFSCQSQLNIHKRVHTGELPYKCHICNKYFNQRSNLQTHIKRHPGMSPYQCNICQKSFLSARLLKDHLREHTPAWWPDGLKT